MTVRDLIEYLQTCNQHSVVKVCSQDGGSCHPLIDKFAWFNGDTTVFDEGDEVLLPASVILLFED